jgi:hypothetical protein
MRHVPRGGALAACLLGLSAGGAHAAAPVGKSTIAQREFVSGGFRVVVDPSRQVIGVDIPEERGFGEFNGPKQEDAAVAPTLAASGGFVSASVLAQKAKQFDDGLYAAVDLAAEQGAGRFAGKKDLLLRLARRRAQDVSARGGNADVVLFAAAGLGGVPVTAPPGLQPLVASATQEFLADALRSKPIGFYTWSGPLTAIFRQDRMLQSELKGEPGIEALARAIHGDPAARGTYEGYLRLVSRLTNPLVGADLRGPLRTLDEGGSQFPAKGVAFFPASRAHETDLVKKLYGNRPIPEGFDLVNEMVRRIRAGQIDLAPTPASGWYDYQTWALEPLVAPERAAESARLKLEASYRKQLEELFKGVLALTRETHVKQLEVPAPGAAAPSPGPLKIFVNPELSAEPLATYYARRAASYRFVRSVLEETFGAEALRTLHRQTDAGPVESDLASELRTVEALFAGAAAAVSRELGMPAAVTAPPLPAPARSPEADVEAFRRWARTLNADPDLGRDARMMVPVFFDRGRRKTKVWVFLGWSHRPAHFWFERPPAVEVTKAGRPATAEEVQVNFGSGHLPLAYPVTAEVYVERVLDRAEFRRHCDTHKTRSAILKNLQ